MRNFTLFGFILFFWSCDEHSTETTKKEVTNNRQSIVYYSDKVVIGSQVWAAKNLAVGRYRNGDLIPEVQDPVQWANLTTGAMCFYENVDGHGVTYGYLYNWYAVNDPRGLAPEGYRIPRESDWNILINYLGGQNVAGGKMKDITGFWLPPNTSATNSSRFTALPGGFRGLSGNGNWYFSNMGYSAIWWSAEEYDAGTARNCKLSYLNGSAIRDYNYKTTGYSVRCIKGF